jgi:hypothetical protein
VASNFILLHQNFIKYLYQNLLVNSELFQHNDNEQNRTLADQTDYHRNYLDSTKTLALSPCSNDSTYFELSMTQEPISLLTPIYTPITSPGSSFYCSTALEQLADLAIEKER